MRSAAAAGSPFKPKYSPLPKYPSLTLSGSAELHRDRAEQEMEGISSACGPVS